MPASPARIAANQANALRSTGPKTDEGKARSRRNGLKHGLTGAGVVLPDEDVDKVEARFAALDAELAPRTELGSVLVERVAILSVRLERSVRQETSALTERIHAAEADFDEARAADVDRLMREIAENPAAHVRALRRMPEGIDRMLATWEALRSDLSRGAGTLWTGIHRQIADELCGRHADATTFSPFRALSEAFWDSANFLLRPSEGADIAAATARRELARDRLLETIDAEVAGLRAARERLDLATLALDRVGARDRALFNPSKEAILARKYEAATERGLYRALRELKEAEAFAARAEPPPDPDPTPDPVAEPLGSSSPTDPPDPEPATPPGRPTPIGRPGPSVPEFVGPDRAIRADKPGGNRST